VKARLLIFATLVLAGCSTVNTNPVTGQVDVQYNYLSISNGLCGIGLGGPAPQSNVPLPAVLDLEPANPAQYSAIFKVADHTHDAVYNAVRVAQGNEDSLNLNNVVLNVRISGDFATTGPAGLRVLTIKGGCHSIVISGTLHGHGTSEDIKIGDWSDQSTDESSTIDLTGLHEADGSKITVVIGHASGVLLNADEVIDQSLSDALVAYWQLKCEARKELGIPLGTPGPSWLP
jgi:hypothetical protein